FTISPLLDLELHPFQQMGRCQDLVEEAYNDIENAGAIGRKEGIRVFLDDEFAVVRGSIRFQHVEIIRRTTRMKLPRFSANGLFSIDGGMLNTLNNETA
ncbi:MAG: hypothetical protein DWQ49_05690, partial [Bacteroidetes bacterium]